MKERARAKTATAYDPWRSLLPWTRVDLGHVLREQFNFVDRRGVRSGRIQLCDSYRLRILSPVNVSGLTSNEHAGLGTSTLQTWYRYWCDEGRSAEEARRRGIDRKDEVRRLREEIDARYHGGRARKPAGRCLSAKARYP
jgi:hypothetical protein